MRMTLSLAGLLLAGLGGAPALATPCADEITTLERELCRILGDGGGQAAR